MARSDEELEAAVGRVRAVIKKASTHAEIARSSYNKNKADMDTVDQTELMALVSIAESLSAFGQLALIMLEEGQT